MARRSNLLPAALLLAGLVLPIAATGTAPSPAARWLRYPALSPDGNSIAFCFHGDIWLVDSRGGTARPLTTGDAYDVGPVWSPDGKWIAFASDRHGNRDVYLISRDGGRPHRLTFHSADDTPASFTPDGSEVLFSSARVDAAGNVEFPSRRALPELYAVPVDGGRPRQVLSTPALHARPDRTGKRLVYEDRKSLENPWRKHDTAAFPRDIWLYETATKHHTRLTTWSGEDRDPVWAPDQRHIYFLSERSGSFNVWCLDPADPGHPEQVSRHTTHPVRFLSLSDGGDICYGFDGAVWLRPAGADSARVVPIEVRGDRHEPVVQALPLHGDISEFAVSPTGKEVALVIRGEIFVTSTEFAATKRITDTPEQERSVSFSPDGRSLLYAGERGGSWNLYLTRLVRDDEPYFYDSTVLEEKTLLDDGHETFQPVFSPDGKEVAYLQDRNTIRILNLDTGRSRTVLPARYNYSYADGDQWFTWSPDGRWLLAEMLSPGRWSTEVGLVDVRGGHDPVNLTLSGYEDSHPRWGLDGKMMYWFSDRYGKRAHGGWQAERDVLGMFFTRKAWDRWQLSPAELAAADAFKDQDKGDKKDQDAKKKDKKKGARQRYPAGFEPRTLATPVTLDLQDLPDRTTRLTRFSSAIRGAVLSPDGETLYYLTGLQGRYDLWSYAHRKDELKKLAALGAKSAWGLETTQDGKSLLLIADGKLESVDAESGKVKPVPYKAEMNWRPAAERAYLFEHVWRQMKEKFYRPDMQGVDWNFYKRSYARFLPSLDNTWDFSELLSEMLGELNASHTGSGYRPKRPDGDKTASLGALYDPAWRGDGLRIQEILERGPLQVAGADLAPGMIITAIDDQPIRAGENWYPLLNRKAGQPVLLTVTDGRGKHSRRVTVRPVSRHAEGELLYHRWVESRRAAVDSLSGGRLGYVHVRWMDESSYRTIFAEIMGRYTRREGLVVDTRFNSGGNLTEFLVDFLSGRAFARDVPRGRDIGGEPSLRWTKPSVVVMNEGNYSDADFFPWAYRELKLGKLVGMPTDGTATAVWWEDLMVPGLFFGIPEVGVQDHTGRYLENRELVPDIVVDNLPGVVIHGRDQQLEAAVTALLQQLDAARRDEDTGKGRR